MRVVVTGGAGFIGSHVADALVERGHDVLVLDDLTSGMRDYVPDGAEFREIDIRNAEAVAEAFAQFQPEAVVHQAAVVSVPFAEKNPELTTSVNVQGTGVLLKAARENGVSVFVFASTAGVYGSTDQLPIPEEAAIDPYNHYAVTKQEAEEVLQTPSEHQEMRVVVLRYANVYGSRQTATGEGGVVAIFARALLDNQEPVLFGDGEQTRDFVHVSDIVEANLHVLSDTRCEGIYNVGTGEQTSINTIIAELRQKTGSNSNVVQAPPRVPDVRAHALDATKMRGMGWEPTTTISEGIAETVSWAARQS